MSATRAEPVRSPSHDSQALRELGLLDEVTASRSLLDLQDDWDDRGSPGYAEATWTRAVDFLVTLARRLTTERATALISAEVLPGAAGSIDLELRTEHRRLLVSVPPNAAMLPVGRSRQLPR